MPVLAADGVCIEAVEELQITPGAVLTSLQA